jgi:hypothetical protein
VDSGGAAKGECGRTVGWPDVEMDEGGSLSAGAKARSDAFKSTESVLFLFGERALAMDVEGLPEEELG